MLRSSQEDEGKKFAMRFVTNTRYLQSFQHCGEAMQLYLWDLCDGIFNFEVFNIGWHVGWATTNYFHSGGIEREKWKIITKNNKQISITIQLAQR